MKNTVLLLILLCGASITLYGQKKYDFAQIKSGQELMTMLLKIEKENESVKLDTLYNYHYNEISIKGMYYDVIPIKTAIVKEGHTELIPDFIDYTVKALVKILEEKKGALSELPTSYNDYVGFEWSTETGRGEINIDLEKFEDPEIAPSLRKLIGFTLSFEF